MKTIHTTIVSIVTISFMFLGSAYASDQTLKMSTTTSTQASGLLDILLPAFTSDTGIVVKVIAKGTGAAIRDGIDGNVDVIFVHAKDRELKFIADGYGTKRYAVMHNDFVIVGPPEDKAKIKGLTNAVAAFTKIAESGILFVSRGDDSGTHTKEQFLWRQTGLIIDTSTEIITKKGKQKKVSFSHPQGLGQWYLSIGQGMGKTLTFADEKRAYTLADRGTYLKYTLGSDMPVSLKIVCEGDERLANPYGVIPVNPKTHPHVKHINATKFAEWLVAEKGQRLIANYKLMGRQLFFPDAFEL